jgi:hypothetical protein
MREFQSGATIYYTIVIDISNFATCFDPFSESSSGFVKLKAIYERISVRRNNILYNCHWILVILRHFSTHLASHPQALLNLRLFMREF